MNKLLSIIIPTKNRAGYCISVLTTLLKNTYDNFEIIIQDNSDSDSIKSYLEREKITDPRLVYNYIKEPLSFISNFNQAIEIASGKYVIVIGDDDGITENLFKVVEWADKNNVDSVCPVELVHYVWPNTSSNGKMVIPYSTRKIWTNKPLNNMQDLLEDGIIQYMNFNLPKLYHGIVLKERLEDIKRKTGNYLGGLTPDIYASIALSATVKNHVVISFPLTIAGASPKSATIDNTKGKHSGKLDNAPHFRNRGNYVWDENVPKYYSVQTIWAETALQAMKEMDIKVNVEKLNLEKMLAGALIDSNEYAELFIDETLKLRQGLTRGELVKNVEKYRKTLKIKGLAKQAFYRMPRRFILRNIRLTNIIDINQCTEISNKELSGRYDIQKILKSYKGQFQKI